MKTTIKDIAKALNLHHSTVSRALNEHPDISQETREMVFAMAEELDYQPDAIAQSFRNRESKTLGIVVPEVNDFFAAVIRGIEEVSYTNGYIILVAQSNESFDREVINIQGLISHQVAGVLISVSQATHDGGHFDIFQRREIPLVLFDRVCKDVPFNKVVVNDYQGAYEVVSHLIDQGYERIVHLAGPPDVSVSKSRLEGYRAALQDHNLPVQPEWIVSGGFSQEDGMRALQQIQGWQERPDAIFAVNDPVAIGAYFKIKEYGWRIPEEVALAGFGNTNESAIAEPAITTVNQSPYNIGRIAAEMIFAQIMAGDTRTAPRKEVLATQLIIRASTRRRTLTGS